MPSAHGPIFCRKEFREKDRVKVQFYWSESLHFLSQTKHRTYLTIFYRECHLAHTTRFLPELTMAGEVPLLDYVTPIFYQTEVSAQGPIFCRTRSQRTQTDFHSDYVSMTKNQSVCAGH